MAEYIINNACQVRLIWALDGTPYSVNVLHGIKQNVFTNPSQSGVDALGADLKTKFLASTLKPLISSRISLVQVGIRDVNSPNKPEVTSAIASCAGTDVNGPLPGAVALCTTLRTGKAGRSFRGRVYLSGYGTDCAAGNNTTAAVAAATADWWNTRVMQALSTAGLDWAVASRRLGTAEKITAAVVRDLQWDTQRRRNSPGI